MNHRVRRGGRVIAAGGRTIAIRLDPDACGPCRTGQGCGAGLQFFTRGEGEILRVPWAGAAFPPGTRVIVSMSDALLGRLGGIAYGAPLVGLFGGLIAATLFDTGWLDALVGGFAPAAAGVLPPAPPAGDFFTLCLLAGGLLAGLATGRRLSRRLLPAALELAIEPIAEAGG